MNLVLAVVADVGGAAAGRGGAGLHRPAPGDRVGARRIASRARRHPASATGSCACRGARCAHLGGLLDRDRHQGRPRGAGRAGARGAARSPCASRPDPQTKFEIGDIGVFPNVHPSVRRSVQGDPADRAGLKPGDVVAGGERRADEHVAAACRARSPSTRASRSRCTIRRDGAGAGRHADARASAARRAIIGIAIGEELKTIEPGPPAGAEDEPRSATTSSAA